MKHKFGQAKIISSSNRYATIIAIILVCAYIFYSETLTFGSGIFVGILIIIGLTLNLLNVYILVDTEQLAIFRVKTFLGLGLSTDTVSKFNCIELLYLNQSTFRQTYTSTRSQRTLSSRGTQYSVYLKSNDGLKHKLYSSLDKDKIKQESIELSKLLNIGLTDNTE